MCFLNFEPNEEGDNDEDTFPRGSPQLLWAIPVDVGKLGATLQSVVDTMPQVTTLRLCHRFRACALSTLSQELLDQIVTHIQRALRAKLRPTWKQEFLCFQGMCLPEEHYTTYNEQIESIWQKEMIGNNLIRYWKEVDPESCSNEEKVDIVQDAVMSNWNLHEGEDGWTLHDNATSRWIERTCLCKKSLVTEKPGGFFGLNNILRTQFGLEVIVLHEILSPTMHRFLPNRHSLSDRTYFTATYLTLASPAKSITSTEEYLAPDQTGLFAKRNMYRALQEVIDPSQLALTEEQRMRFMRAMKRLHIKPRYHLSKLEPHVIHPIEDEILADLCSCHTTDCLCGDIKSWDKPFNLEQLLSHKSKELARESWPKLMMIEASDVMYSFEGPGEA